MTVGSPLVSGFMPFYSDYETFWFRSFFYLENLVSFFLFLCFCVMAEALVWQARLFASGLFGVLVFVTMSRLDFTYS